MELQRHCEYIHKLELRRYLVQAHAAVLDRLMCEVLADINVLGTLPQSHALPTRCTPVQSDWQSCMLARRVRRQMISKAISNVK